MNSISAPSLARWKDDRRESAKTDWVPHATPLFVERRHKRSVPCEALVEQPLSRHPDQTTSTVADPVIAIAGL